MLLYCNDLYNETTRSFSLYYAEDTDHVHDRAWSPLAGTYSNEILITLNELTGLWFKMD
jgi:hypothetical protein